jgi:hypothetical protein
MELSTLSLLPFVAALAILRPIMAKLFTCLIILQFVIILTHDLIDVPGWVHGSQVQAQIGRRKVWLATLANSVLPGIAAGFAIYFWSRPKPGFVQNYWVFTVLSR